MDDEFEKAFAQGCLQFAIGVVVLVVLGVIGLIVN